MTLKWDVCCKRDASLLTLAKRSGRRCLSGRLRKFFLPIIEICLYNFHIGGPTPNYVQRNMTHPSCSAAFDVNPIERYNSEDNLDFAKQSDARTRKESVVV
jgi:hypothetical protein